MVCELYEDNIVDPSISGRILVSVTVCVSVGIACSVRVGDGVGS